MRILHISDLHITPPHESLEQVWVGPSAAIVGQSFDYIVVSGDLSQRAAKEEYDALRTFAEQSLLPRLTPRGSDKEPDLRSRVIFVPGNHDVEWSRGESFIPLRFSDFADDDKKLRKYVDDLKQHPETGDTRMFLGGLGHMELLRVDPDKYRHRFTNVSQFLCDFYGSKLGEGLHRPNSRPFNLLDKSGSGDWSAHVFPDDGVAFIGLSSCDRNDRYWQGARFNSNAVVSAQRHVLSLKERYKDMLFIGVWHHGFVSEVGRPDRLVLSDIGSLWNIGIRLGFHGHTHVKELSYKDLLKERIAIIATGSIGAGPPELPPGVDNQFSIAHVYPTRVEVERYQLDRQEGIYKQQPKDKIGLFRGNFATHNALGTLQNHKRSWRVNRDGIAEVTVELDGVNVSGSLPLAVVSPPFCDVSCEKVSVPEGEQDVEKISLLDGRIRFSWPAQPVEKLSWRYYISNAVALHQGELALFPPRQQWYKNIKPTEDARSHTVRLSCDMLQLTLKFEDSVPALAGARVQVERRGDDGHQDVWRVDPLETERAKRGFTFNDSRREASISIAAPIVGHRYSIVFEPAQSADNTVLSDEAKTLTAHLLRACREKMASECKLRERLTEIVARAIRAALEVNDEEPIGAWLGLLWSPERRKLFTAFGNFPPQSWAVRFSAGNGIAGHAFRHSEPVAWTRPPDEAREGRTATIFQEMPEHYEAAPVKFKWVLNIPILIAKEGPSIGVVGFARRDSNTSVDRRLEDLAARLNRNHHPGGEPLLASLGAGINIAFWAAMEDSVVGQELTPELRAYAGRCLKALSSS